MLLNFVSAIVSDRLILQGMLHWWLWTGAERGIPLPLNWSI